MIVSIIVVWFIFPCVANQIKVNDKKANNFGMKEPQLEMCVA